MVDEAEQQLCALRAAAVDRVMCRQPDYTDLDAIAPLGETVRRWSADAGASMPNSPSLRTTTPETP